MVFVSGEVSTVQADPVFGVFGVRAFAESPQYTLFMPSATIRARSARDDLVYLSL